MKIKRIIIVFALIISISLSVFMFMACESLFHTHDWDEWIVTVEPTCTDNGEKTRICLFDSKHKETQAIDVLGHDWDEWFLTAEPSETDVGIKTRACKRDSSHTQMLDVPATGMSGETGYPTLNGNHAIFRLNSDERFHAYVGGWVYVSIEDSYNSAEPMISPLTEPSPPPRTLYRMIPDRTIIQQMPHYIAFHQYSYHNNWLYMLDTSLSFFRMRLDGSEKQELSSQMVSQFVIHGEWIYYQTRIEYDLYRLKLDGSQNQLIANECLSFITEDDYIFMAEGPSHTNRQKMVRLDSDGTNKITLIGEILEDTMSPIFTHDNYLYYGVGSYITGKGDRLCRMKYDGSDIETIIEHEKYNVLQNIFYNNEWIYFNRSYNDNGYLESEICKIRADGTGGEQILETYRGGGHYFIGESFMMSTDAIIYASCKADGSVLLNSLDIDNYYNYLIGNFGVHYQGYFIHNNKIYVATTLNPADTYKLLWIDGYINDYDDGWVYTRSYGSYYKMRPDGSEKEEIPYEDYQLKFHGAKNGEWIYYVDVTQESSGCIVWEHYSLCRVRLDGTNKEILANEIGNFYSNQIKDGFVLYCDWIYFTRQLSDGLDLCRIKLDGSGEQQIASNLDSFYIESDYIFTTKRTWIETYTLYNTQLVRYNLDGSKAKVLTEAQNTDYTFDFANEGFLYFTSYQRNSGYYNLNRIKLDGSNRIVVIEHEFSSGTIHLKDGWIYYLYRYQDRTNANKLTYITTIYKIRPDGTGRTVVRDPVAYSSSHSSVLGESSFLIIDDNIYYAHHYETTYGENGLQYWKLSLDGELNLLYDSYGVEIVVGSFIHDGELYIVIWN